MPRTIDQIVEAHRLARSRIDAGLNPWARKVDIKSAMNRDPSNTSNKYCAAVSNEIGASLRKAFPLQVGYENALCDEDLTEIVEGMEALRSDSYNDDPTYSPREDLNDMLDALYDWADREQVWLGF